MRVDFSKFSSVKIGAELEVAELNEVCNFDGFIIGKACNLLVGEPKQALAMLGRKFDYIKLDNDILRIGAKEKIEAFCSDNMAENDICSKVIEPGKAGMNSIYFVFVNMTSSSCLIQLCCERNMFAMTT